MLRRACLLAVALLAAAAVWTGVASAAFLSKPAGQSMAVSTQTPQPVTGLSAAGCPLSVTLTWKASPSPEVAHYLVLRGTTLLATLAPTKTSYTDIPLGFASYTYTVRTQVGSNTTWTADASLHVSDGLGCGP